MQDFDDALQQFLNGRRSFADLTAAAARAAAENEATRAHALSLLERHSTHAKLPPQAYLDLKALLDDSTRLTAGVTRLNPELDDDRTRAVSGTTHSTSAPPAPPASAQATDELTVGGIVKERFVLKEILGVGGMGTVFKALDLRKVEANDREAFVALKLLNPDFRANPMALMALQRETKRAQTLSHPNIINVYDFDRDGQNVFMTMEYLSGYPLSQLIRELSESGSRFRRAWPIIEAMAEALGHAHHKGVVHSDFKPGNVFIDDQLEVKVLDFGIACAVGRKGGGTTDATVFNARQLGALTPAYASLEQLRDCEPDPRDDIYALACVTYELLSGKHPFGKLSADKALELNLQPKPIAGLGRRQWKGLQHALALQQQDRTPDIETFLRDLRPRSPWYYAMAAAVAIVLGLAGTNIYLTLAPRPLPSPPAPLIVQLTPEQQRKINDLLELAGAHFDVGFLTAPTGSNALWAYRQVLKVDPYNEDAIKGIKKIADTLEQQAWEAYEQGDRAGSLKKVMEGLEAEPGHEGLTKLKAKLQG